jgi:NAD(P)H-nitrite reductase large subunit
MQRYVMIGSGAAGWAAAEAIRRRDRSGEITILTSDPHGYYSRPGLAYYLTGEVNENQLHPFQQDFWNDLKVRWHVEPVTAVHPGQQLVQFKSGKTLPYDRLLLATGSTALLPDVPGIHLEGVVKLDDLEDARQILKLARRGETAVVVGGGITALELVEGLVERGLRVHYFLRGERYWNSVLDPTESRIIEERLTGQGVRIHYQTSLVEIQGEKGRVRAVVANQAGSPGVRIPCRMVAVAIGIRPRKELADGAGLGVKRGILATTTLQTSNPSIFAAGDVAEVINPASGQSVLDSLWHPALEMGAVAGANMTGECQRYTKLIPYNVTRLAGLVTTIIGQIASQPDAAAGDSDLNGGIMRGDSETWRQMPEAVVAQTFQDSNRLRLYIRQNTIAGALVMGRQEISRPLQHLIRSRVDITSIRAALLTPQADLTGILHTFWQEQQRSNAVKIA